MVKRKETRSRKRVKPVPPAILTASVKASKVTGRNAHTRRTTLIENLRLRLLYISPEM